MMRIIFMGTPEFAIPSLKILIENKYEIVGVVTVPDRSTGRGLHFSYSPIKAFALKNKLTVMQPEQLKDQNFIQQLYDLQPDLFVVVAFRILPLEVYRIPKFGAFNLHASLLPKYRGAAPINWAIINGEKETGVTTFFLEEKVDTGNILLQARLPIDSDETAGELHDKLASVGAEIVFHTVRLIESGKAIPKSQDSSVASIAPKIFKEYCRIDWRKSAQEIHNFIRGLSPKPCAFTYHGNNLIKIYRSHLTTAFESGNSGEVVRSDSRLVVYSGQHAIEILELQQEGKKKLSAEEYLRGYRISIGDKFS